MHEFVSRPIIAKNQKPTSITCYTIQITRHLLTNYPGVCIDYTE